MIGYGLDPTGLSKRLGKVFRGCGSFPYDFETAVLVVLYVLDSVMEDVGKVAGIEAGIVHTVTGGRRVGKTRPKGYILFRALLKKNFPLCLA